jgi:hypothetical protein
MGVIQYNHLTDGKTGASASSANTASISPKTGRGAIISVLSKINGSTPNIPTVTGDSMTWNQYKTRLYQPSQQMRLTQFYAVADAPSAGVLAIAFGGQTQDKIMWTVHEFDFLDKSSSGANIIIQSPDAVQSALAVGTSVNLAAFADPNNGTLAVLGVLNPATVSVGAGFTQLSNDSDGEITLVAAFKAFEDDIADFSWAANSFSTIIIGNELNALAPAEGQIF